MNFYVLTTILFQQCSLALLETLSCSENMILRGNDIYHFNVTDIHRIAPSEEICETTGFSMAAAPCMPNSTTDGKTEAIFLPSYLKATKCGTTIAQLKNSTAYDFQDKILAQLLVLTSRPRNLGKSDINNALDILGSYANDPRQNISSESLELAARIIGQVLMAGRSIRPRPDRTTLVGIVSTALQTLNNLTRKSALTSHFSSFTNISTPDINVQLKQLSDNDYDNGEINLNLADLEAGSNVQVSFSIQSVKDAIKNSKNSIATIYATLLTNRVLPNSTASPMVTLGVGEPNGNQLQSLNVTISYTDVFIPDRVMPLSNPLQSQLNQQVFSEWSYDQLIWLPARKCSRKLLSRREFQCTNLATFAMIFNSRVVQSVVALAAVSYAGCALSIIFLMTTIVIYLTHKKLREKAFTMTLVNLCCCLIGIYLLYAAGINRVENDAVCDAMTFLLHYATLACIGWMAANSYQMLRAFTSLTYKITKPNLKVYLLVYGLPFTLVMLNFSLTVLYLDYKQDNGDSEDIYFESLYRSRFACWLQAPSLIYGFLLPVGVLLIFNLGVFIVLVKEVLFRKEKVQSTIGVTSTKDRLLNAITIIVMMGLTWIFGYLLLAPVNKAFQEAMQWLFTLFNVFQGVVIFYLYCLRREDVRKIWIPSLKRRTFNFSSKSKDIEITTCK